MRRSKKQFALTLVSIFALSVFSMQIFTIPNAYAATTVTISPSQQYQTIQGWGTSMAWWANIIGGWSDSQRTSLADALYDPNKGIGLNLARYNFGADGPGNVCHNQMKEGRNVPSFEPSSGTYNWSNDANQLWFAQAAKARGADIFEGFVNSAPAWMLLNSCTAGGPSGAENLSTAHYTDFANYIAAIAQHFHDSFGITLQTVDPFNEPSHTWWSSTGSQEGMMVTPASQSTIIPLVATALAQNGASAYTAVSAPDDNQIGDSLNDYNAYSSTARADMGQWNTHAYGGSDTQRNSAYTNIGQGAHKRLWMSEWGITAQGTPIAAALSLSHEILDDEQNLHPSSWVAWQAVNEAGDTPDSVWGLAYRDSSNNITYPARYYAMGNYSKFVREGYQVIGNNDPNTLTAYNTSSKTLVIVSTNSSTSSTAVNYDLSNFSSAGTAATPYQTSASENLAQLSSITIANNALSSTLPAQSVTTFVIPNITIGGGGTTTYHTLTNRNSGKVLDVTNASTANGAAVIQYTANGGTNQQWSETAVSGGYIKFVNHNSGKVLDVTNASTADGAAVIQYTDNGGTNQQWSLISVGGGYYKIVNRNSGKVLDVSGASTADGAAVIQYTDNGGTNQQWSLS